MSPSEVKTYGYCKSNCLRYLCLLVLWITMGSSHKYCTSSKLTLKVYFPKVDSQEAWVHFLLSNHKSFGGGMMRSLNPFSGFLRMTHVSLNELTLLGFRFAHVLDQLLKDIALLPPWKRSDTMIHTS